MKRQLIAAAVLSTLAGVAAAQSNVTVYGRVDLSVAQQAAAVENKEVRNGSGSRLGFRGTEDLGDGLKAVFQIEHRFNADEGTQSNASRFWEGKSIVGLEGGFGRLTLGREENPAYTYAQTVADPWGTDTVASNGSIINGRIGSTRYSNSVNYRFAAQGFTFGAQMAEAEGNSPASASSSTGNALAKKPYSVGLAYANGPITLGLGYENPADADDHWMSVYGGYNFGFAKLGLFYGTGDNAAAQEHQSYLVSATAPVAGGEFRVSYGQLKNKDTDIIRDKQFSAGYFYPLSKRTTIYADVVNKKPDNLTDGYKKTGYDLGIRHNF
jgi:predicted porin